MALTERLKICKFGPIGHIQYLRKSWGIELKNSESPEPKYNYKNFRGQTIIFKKIWDKTVILP